jgi:hypothetical protein
MAAIQSPATILALLKKARAAYQKAKPDLKSKPEQRHKEITKDLQRLRVMVRKKGTPEGARLVRPFKARKKILLKKLTEHRKKLNSAAEKNTDGNKAQLPAFAKALLRITTAVLRLDFALATADEEPANLEALEEGDPAELDRLDQLSDEEMAALEQEDDAALPEAGEEGGEQESEETEPAAPSGAAVVKRLLALNAEYTAAIAKPGPHVAVLKAQYQKVRDAIDDKDFAAADKGLDGLQTLLGRVRELAAKVPEANGALKGWQTARAQAINDLRKVATAIARTRDPEAAKMVMFLEAVVKNLPLNPSGPQAFAELARYIETDDVIPAAEQAPPHYGGPLKIRQPLLDAVRQLQQGASAS